MNIIVHLMFAVTIRKSVKKKLGIALNLRGFLYGNILPDISRKYGHNPHYIKGGLPHVIRSKDRLLDLNQREALTPYRFAKELGAINHYLSDFFCLPHLEGHNRSKTYHGLYELTMIARYRKGLRAFKKVLKEHEVLIKPNELRGFILDQNKAYSRKKGCQTNDIGYALFTGVLLSQCLLMHSEAFSELTAQASDTQYGHSFL